MTRVVGDPEEIRKFAQRLRIFNTLLENNTSQLENQFRELSETWRDQEHQKFAQEFEHTMRVIHHFNEVFKQQEPLLYKKAELLQAYLDSR
jgi:uncharacterized protein YukE